MSIQCSLLEDLCTQKFITKKYSKQTSNENVEVPGGTFLQIQTDININSTLNRTSK